MSDQDELKLALEFQNHFKDGKEIKPSETGLTLHQLGLVYKKRSPDKLSLLKSAVLLNGAILRKTDNAEEVADDLHQLCSEVLELAGARNKSADLVAASRKALPKIQEMRKNAERDINLCIQIPDAIPDINKNMMQQLQKSKIKQVQAIQNQITADFIEVMDGLSKFCCKTLGDPPCKFALVGMGSLARREITPYSDFEQMIILEEGVQTREDYQEILKYFRWFAMIFLITLINFGEMIIPFADIESFRLFKYRDEVATVGICPDGFSLSAGKNAICGKIELINTPSQMVKYLCPDTIKEKFPDMDILKTAHLINVLSKTRFVSGDEKVHDELVSRSHKIFLENYAQHMEVLQATLYVEYINFDISMKLGKYFEDDQLDIKRIVYRTSTLYIVALGKHYQLQPASCYDILSLLSQMDLISKDDMLSLKYATALACEVRLKIYMKSKGQEDKVSDKNVAETKKLQLINAVGMQSAIDYFNITASLQQNARIIITEKQQKTLKLHQIPVFGVAQILTDVKTAIEYCEKIQGRGTDLGKSNQLNEVFGMFNRFVGKASASTICKLATNNANMLKVVDRISELRSDPMDFAAKLVHENEPLKQRMIDTTLESLGLGTEHQEDVERDVNRCFIDQTWKKMNTLDARSITPEELQRVTTEVLNKLKQPTSTHPENKTGEKRTEKDVDASSTVPPSTHDADSGDNNLEADDKNTLREKIQHNFKERAQIGIDFAKDHGEGASEEDIRKFIDKMWCGASENTKEMIVQKLLAAKDILERAHNVDNTEMHLVVERLNEMGISETIKDLFANPNSNAASSSSPVSLPIGEAMSMMGLCPRGGTTTKVFQVGFSDLQGGGVEEIVQQLSQRFVNLGKQIGYDKLHGIMEQSSERAVDIILAYAHKHKIQIGSTTGNEEAPKNKDDFCDTPSTSRSSKKTPVKEPVSYDSIRNQLTEENQIILDEFCISVLYFEK